MTLTKAERTKLLLLGAAARLDMLNTEMKTLYREFPSLRVNVAPVITKADQPRIDRRMNKAFKPRPKMSRAARQAISNAQKARWAKQKAAAK
jgi:ApbE superfamily uncharacterized protein (UPF0280 family)